MLICEKENADIHPTVTHQFNDDKSNIFIQNFYESDCLERHRPM